LYILLIDRESGKFFDALQEQASRDEYGTVLGRLVCFYIRLLSLDDEIEPDECATWFKAHPLKSTQVNCEQTLSIDGSIEFQQGKHCRLRVG